MVGGRAAADAPGPRDRPAPQVRGQVLRRRHREREDLPRRPQPLPPHRRHRRRELPVRGRQRRAVRRRGWRCSPTGSASRPGWCFGAVVPDGRRGDRRRRARVGRAAGRRRLVADAADRAVHGRRPAGRAADHPSAAAQRQRRAAAGADPAAVDRRRAERRRHEGAQEQVDRQAGRRRGGRAGARVAGPRWSATSASRCSRSRSCCRRWSWPSCCAGGGGVLRAKVSARFVGAWRELVDHARDLGQPIPVGVGRDPARAVARDRLARGAGPWPTRPTATCSVRACPGRATPRPTGARSTRSARPCRPRWPLAPDPAR